MTLTMKICLILFYENRHYNDENVLYFASTFVAFVVVTCKFLMLFRVDFSCFPLLAFVVVSC